MGFFKRLFARGPEDYLAKGDGYFAAHSFYEARTAFEAGLEACRGTNGQDGMVQKLEARICDTKRAMAELNMQEAEHALRCGAIDKAAEHLELAKTLTDDARIREKADQLLAGIKEETNATEIIAPAAAAHGSCSSCSGGTCNESEAVPETDAELPVLEHYDLLIHQLPEEMYGLYSSLGEKFACMFIAASQDSHQEALDLLEGWFDGSHRDIYCYEKGKILHRLGRIGEAEACLRESIRENAHNPLPQLGLALLLIDDRRIAEAAAQLDSMISADIFTGQAMMMRGEIYQHVGDTEAAIQMFGRLLDTPLARAAAEKLHGLLLECDRKPEAAHIFKRYLGKCQH